MISIVAKNISKSFSHPRVIPVLKDLSFDVKKGESLAITGPSGVGKSTLLHILGCLEEPTCGEVFINGVKFTNKTKALIKKEHIGFIFQSYHLFEDLTVIDNVLMPSKIARKNTKKNSPSYKRALELLDQVGLTDRIDFSVNLLSGGEKQRVAIARALQNDPSIILADEPTGNLDSKNSKAIEDLILSTTKDKSLIVVTHDDAFAKRCDSRLHLT